MECSICIEPILIKTIHEESYSEIVYDTIGELLPCHHKFHSDCIRKWHTFATDLNCPICRTTSLSMSLIYNYKLWYEKRVHIDLNKGFLVESVLEYDSLMSNNNLEIEETYSSEIDHGLTTTQQDNDETNNSDLSTLFQTILNIEEMNDDDSEKDIEAEQEVLDSMRKEYNTLLCRICGDDEETDADTRCPDCNARYHEGCLHVTASEIGESDTWQQCIECRAQTEHMRDNRRTNIREPPMLSLPSIQNDNITESTREDELERIRETKRKIQNHVRSALKLYYCRSSPIRLTKEQFTNINQTVSRTLYLISDNKYQEKMNYDHHAKEGVVKELQKLGYIEV
ncbi:similar to Saccharomyces cerevisiae YPR093C ASR1 Ubiquitin ligase that modifies and regulates RNA Pol II [Maudiozyma barnettii]|uniref:Similar to Saccharomyces cerevisiae YPR093C ASR1 Ubiquitin ligase that modifies and regulates RNA Pol II n=1 Tax=Maudiozyma barnettii TaxID=61262 RepID=A0A8H2ZFS2_9SACH|nr:ubiquitin-protein ligase ASR1 [Kazachstania barnettii]CAB4252065.1 similar to Saccharomyces cerevisiae YPR093C ASR1 Ubiquitin ligase that modifies and regulates RNA Pol II [Kazachstania barnettii]CAD1778547.1 similar to Saccharomyces cerevisiae YPR093C ASR1 Ubiquitin ligase that modifies and regulates RNA Pol II [Kazachstania barnettii]